MAKGDNSMNSKRNSRGAKPYDANNSFVKKVATKVTDLIPQKSWISKWFNSSQDNGEILNDTDLNPEDSDNEEETTQPPPSKRPRIRMDITHPPGTFDIQPRSRNQTNEDVDIRKEQYPVHNETADDFLEPSVAGTSGTRHIVASTPAIQSEIRTTNIQRNRSDFISLTNNGVTNGTDDNSESSESTSGCSSLIPQVNRQEGSSSSLGYNNRSFNNRKRYIDDKLNFTNHLQSPRSLFLDSNPRDSLSSRRPSFNASVMNNSIERGASFSSPFYNGNTTFGGANTAGFQRQGRTLFNSVNELQLKVPNRTNIQVKSPNAAGTDSSGMSQTAKRILEALEHFSSPILDAKKIPMNTSNNSSPIGGKKRLRNEISSTVPLARVGLRHLTRELTVPTVPDLLNLRRRQRLQDTTLAARKIVSARSVPPPNPQEYRLRSDDDDKSKYAGKVKAKDKTEFENIDFINETVNLPNISLPISSLPTFDIMLPVNTSNNNSYENSRNGREELFKFASPIKVTDTTRNLKSINNFTFSKPLNANEKDSTEESFTLSKTLSIDSSSSSLSSNSNFIWSNTSTAPKLKEKYKEKDSNVNDGLKVANNLKTGSVMDILGKNSSDPLMDAWKPAVGMWECGQCLIRNSKEASQCVACKALKSIPKIDRLENTSSSSLSSTVTDNSQSKPIVADCFGSQFKMSSNQWECEACLVRNKQTDTKCVSCTTPRTGITKTPPTNSTSNLGEPGKSDLMEKFKPPEGSWECPGCMLRNPGNVETCPCCNASKPGSLKISPKKVSAETEVFNSVSNSCADGLPGKLKSEETIETQKLSTNKIKVSGFGDKFKKPEGVWTCDDCMLQNKGETSECIACGAVKPGSKKVTKTTSITTGNSGSTLQFNFGMPENTGGFNFGIIKKDEKIDEAKPEVPVVGGFSFGVKSESPKTGGFTFGVPQNTTGFTFGVNQDKEKDKLEEKKINTIENIVSKKRSLDIEEQKNPPSFSFGVVNKSEEANKSINEKKFAFDHQNATTISSSSPSLFSFGGIKTESGTEKSNEIPKITFDISNTDSPKLNFTSSTNEKPSIIINNVSNSIVKKSSDIVDTKPTFGIKNSSVTTSSVSAITTTVSSSPKPGLFSFGSSTTIPNQTASPGQGFGQNSTTPASAMFLLGSNKPTNGPTTIAHAEKSPAPSFGVITNGPGCWTKNPATLFSDGNENKLTPVFGVADNKSMGLFGSTETKAPVFGTQDNKTLQFGSNKKPATAGFNPATPSFGTPTSTPAFGSPNSFGNPPTPSGFGTNSTTSMFAPTKPAENTIPVSNNSGSFNFGGNTAQQTPQQTTGRFNFTGNNPVVTPSQQNSTQKNLFSFGNNSITQQTGTGFGNNNNFNTSTTQDSTPQNFAFNSPKPDSIPAFGQNTPIATPMFGTPQSTTNFGQNQTTTPAFGSPAPTPNSGFNFGGSGTAPSSGFNFGSQQAPTAAPPTGGFTFNAPSQSPAIAFDPNTRPTFNFTGGSAPTEFSATPQTTQPRKVKKAVRRTQPR